MDAAVQVTVERGQVVMRIRAQDGRAMTLRVDGQTALNTAQHLVDAVRLTKQ